MPRGRRAQNTPEQTPANQEQEQNKNQEQQTVSMPTSITVNAKTGAYGSNLLIATIATTVPGAVPGADEPNVEYSAFRNINQLLKAVNGLVSPDTKSLTITVSL